MLTPKPHVNVKKFHIFHINYNLKLPPRCNFRANFLQNRIPKNLREIKNKLTV